HPGETWRGLTGCACSPMSSAVHQRDSRPRSHAPSHADSCQSPSAKNPPMSQKLKKFRSRAMFTIVGGMVVINPAFAQDSQEATQLDTVQVTGLRSSLDQAMNIKRDSAGIVDAVSAEDIGKFPDTNLAESLQRITGISIERR